MLLGLSKRYAPSNIFKKVGTILREISDTGNLRSSANENKQHHKHSLLQIIMGNPETKNNQTFYRFPISTYNLKNSYKNVWTRC